MSIALPSAACGSRAERASGRVPTRQTESPRHGWRLRLFFVALVCAAAQDQTSSVILRTTTTLVQLSVVAQDSKGAAIKDLTKDDFQIFDNGKEQEIARFAPEEAV